jgi:hypothetical protein
MSFEMEHRNTEFDGKKAMILDGHPHGGKIAICRGADKTAAGWAMKFKDEQTSVEFYVFKAQDISWLD